MYKFLLPESERGKDLKRWFGLSVIDDTLLFSKEFHKKIAVTYGAEDITDDLDKTRRGRKKINETGKYLFARFGAFGDNLIVTSAIKAFKAKYPNAEVHVTGKPPKDVVFKNNPYTDKVVNIRMQDLGLLIDDYDDIFDFTHTIEHNPISDVKEAVEISCDVTGVHPDNGDYSPVFVPTPYELSGARTVLEHHGISPEDDIVILHSDSSSPMRSISYETTKELALELANKGWKVVSPGLMDLSDLCNPNIVSLKAEIENLPSRVIFAIGHYAKKMIVVDSVWLHLAAAFKKPTLAIFGSFDPSVRISRYPTVTPLHRPIQCGPCHQLAGFCTRYHNGIPPCMSQYSTSEIINGFESLEETNRTTVWNRTEVAEKRECIFCGDVARFYTRKANAHYYQCKRCKSYFSDNAPDTNGGWPAGAELRKQYATLIEQFHKAEAPDKLKTFGLFYENKYYGTETEEELLNLGWTKDSPTTVFAFIRWVSSSSNYLEILNNVESEYLFIYDFAGEGVTRNSAQALNAPYAGTAKYIMGGPAWNILAKKIGYEIIKYDIVGDHAVIAMKKVN